MTTQQLDGRQSRAGRRGQQSPPPTGAPRAPQSGLSRTAAPVHERLTPRGRSGFSERARLIVEIVLAYRYARRALRRGPITAVLARIRAGHAGPAGVALPAAVRSSAPHTLDVTEAAEARHLASAVARTLSLLPGDTRCLCRSLVLSRLLARRGIASVLVIGARSVPAFGAHAWVEHGGRAILPPGDAALGRLAEL
jgi:Transglutaminase-like superfamily